MTKDTKPNAKKLAIVTKELARVLRANTEAGPATVTERMRAALALAVLEKSERGLTSSVAKELRQIINGPTD